MSKICYGCFRQTEDDYNICPYCRYELKNAKTSSRALQPGTILNNRYIVGKSLGEGGFGITYLVCDQYTWTKYAIKEYYPSNIAIRDTTMYGGNTLHISTGTKDTAFSDGMRRYVNEASVLSRFSTLSGVVSVMDFFYENATAYIVMEYIDGISLKQYVDSKGGKLTVNEMLNIMEPIIKSLAILHQNNLLHRDISPDNIMISHDGKVKLIDFGAARYFSDDSEKSMTVVLKHGYAPIEQYSRKGEQGPWTDVYALCAVMYKMLTGIVPDEATDRIKTDGLIKVRKLNKKVPKHIAAALEKGLALQPEHRYQDMMSLYYDLYQTKEQLKENRKAKQKTVLIIVLVVCIIAAIVGMELTLMGYFKNHKSSADKASTVEKSNENLQEVLVEKETQDSFEAEPEIETETASQTVSVIEEAKSEPPSSAAMASVVTTRAVVVVRDGYLNGVAEGYTVGNILDIYSSGSGTWSSENTTDGNSTVTYSGYKDGSTFSVIFTVYSDDTFTLVGATQNNVEVGRYTEFFQSILNEAGF
jgi:serine/threonine protein kinase